MGQLGSEPSMAEQVQMGTLEMASVTTAVMQNYVPQTAVMDLPFIWPIRKVAYAVLDDPAWQKKIFSYLPKKGFVGIGWTENEFRDINNTKRPIHAPTVGRFRGGTAIAAVVACVFFAALSGSSPATVVAIGSIMLPALLKAGYHERFSQGLITSAGSLGIVIPPPFP